MNLDKKYTYFNYEKGVYQHKPKKGVVVGKHVYDVFWGTTLTNLSKLVNGFLLDNPNWVVSGNVIQAFIEKEDRMIFVQTLKRSL